ncbi:MAG: DegV family protein [Erysipelotrichaceae bacterium]|jgi:DegV family protein with EDD domain
MGYKIVADSSANLYEIAKVNYTTVPLKINTEIGEFVDQKGIELKKMVDYLYTTKEKSSTSCPNIGEWLKAFEGEKEIYAITISGNLSGSYNSLLKAKEAYLKENPEAKIYTIDSYSTGPEMVLMIEKIIELKQKGLDFEETCAEMKRYMPRCKILFALDSVRNLANNGRVSQFIASLVGVLGIKMLGQGSDEGRIELIYKGKGMKNVLKRMFEEMEKAGFVGDKVVISHVFNDEANEFIINLIKTKYPDCDIKSHLTGGLCAYYAEKNGLILGYETKEK